MTAFYNENDSVAAAVLREASARGVIAPGDVAECSIKDISHYAIRKYKQAHFFAGAGLWSVAARLAGWPDDEPLWTGSCPCQPFSQAGKGLGVDDPRHLWPDFFRLIRECRPRIVVGEQVGGKAGWNWLDGVRADLESENYACWAVDIPACAVDAPHIRSRIYWVAVANSIGGGRDDGLMEHATGERRGERRAEHALRRRGPAVASADAPSDVADASNQREEGLWQRGKRNEPSKLPLGGLNRDGGYWANADWIICHDGKARRAPWGSEPNLCDVAHGFSAGFEGGDPARLLVPSFKGRAAAWKLAGNAIVPQVAAQVLAALQETLDAPV